MVNVNQSHICKDHRILCTPHAFLHPAFKRVHFITFIVNSLLKNAIQLRDWFILNEFNLGFFFFKKSTLRLNPDLSPIANDVKLK